MAVLNSARSRRCPSACNNCRMMWTCSGVKGAFCPTALARCPRRTPWGSPGAGSSGTAPAPIASGQPDGRRAASSQSDPEVTAVRRGSGGSGEMGRNFSRVAALGGITPNRSRPSAGRFFGQRRPHSGAERRGRGRRAQRTHASQGAGDPAETPPPWRTPCPGRRLPAAHTVLSAASHAWLHPRWGRGHVLPWPP